MEGRLLVCRFRLLPEERADLEFFVLIFNFLTGAIHGTKAKDHTRGEHRRSLFLPDCRVSRDAPGGLEICARDKGRGEPSYDTTP